MKFITRKYLSALAASVALSLGLVACESEDIINPDGSGSNGSGVYLAMTVQVPTAAVSRAENETESSENYSAGIAGESKVNKIYLYFFDSNDNVVNFGTSTSPVYYLAFDSSKGEIDSSITGENIENGSDEDTKLGVAYRVGPIQVPQLELNKTYKVLALCNHRLMNFDSATDYSFSTLDEFLGSKQSMASIDDDGGYKNNVPMSSRDYQGVMYKEITPKRENLYKSSPCQFTLQVERSLARITFKNTDKVFTLYKDTNYSETLGTIDIVSREVLNVPPGFYTFRHIGNINTSSSSTYTISFPSGRAWSQPVNSGGSYVVTPYTTEQTKVSGCYASNDTPLVVVPSSKYYSYPNYYRQLFDWLTWDENANGFEVWDETTDGAIGMYPENVCEASAQNRGNCTAVILRGQLLVNSSLIKDSSNVGYYADEYKYLGNNKYQCSLYYYNGYFYYKASSIASYITKYNYQTYGVRKFKYGFGYYIYYIKHKDDGSGTSMGVMEYSVVRNNSYDITINKVALPPYTDDEIDALTTTDMLKDVEQQQSYISAGSTLSTLSPTSSSLGIGD
jgi:hypothetical protein